MLFLFVLECLVLSSHTVESQATGGSLTLLQAISANPNLSSLAGALQAPAFVNVSQALNSSSLQLTLFAPSNQAVSRADLQYWPIWYLYNVLLYHASPVLSPTQTTQQGRGPLFLPTLMANNTLVNIGLNKPQVVYAKTKGDNNPWLLSWGNPQRPETTANTVGNETVCSNGVLYVIDKVMRIPSSALMAAFVSRLELYVWAVWSSNLTGLVQNGSQLTLLAPTNAAWKQFVSDWGTNLTWADVAQVLAYHIVPNRVLYSSLIQNGTLTTYSGQALLVNWNYNYSLVFSSPQGSSAQTVVRNILVKNGVMHSIDHVLIPPNWQPSSGGTSNGGGMPPSVDASSSKVNRAIREWRSQNPAEFQDANTSSVSPTLLLQLALMALLWARLFGSQR